MDAIFVPLANAVGASVDQIKLISCLLISYPLGSIFIRLPSPAIKHLFSIAISIFILVGVFPLFTGFLQLLGSASATYFIARNVKGPSMPWIVFWVVMGHLTVNHIIRALFNLSYETFEITGPQMVLTMKFTTFAWNVWDGRRPVGELDKWQAEKRVVEFPSILEFLGYTFYFPGFLVGPYLDFASYRELINESLFSTKKGKEKEVAEGRRIPKGRKRVAYKKMVFGLIFLGLYVTQIGSFNFSVALQDWFVKKSLLYRILYFQICGIFERTKYYAIWTLTEGASILTGLGFTGYGPSGESLWEGAANVNVPMIEWAPNFKVLLDSWNMKTNVWLRECVYKRVTPPGKKPGFRSSMLTFATSAFWHGVAGGYYLTFLFGGFVQTAGRLCRSNLRPIFVSSEDTKTRGTPPPSTPGKRLYDFVGSACATLLLNYTAAPFMILGIKDSLTVWGRLGWYGNWMIAICLGFFYLGGQPIVRGFHKASSRKTDSDGSGNGARTPMVIPPVDQALNSDKRD